MEIEVGKVYRHFKGNYYYIEALALNSETLERMVIYKPIYDRNDSKIWVRPEKMFFEKIDKNRKDNITGQEFRFEIANEIKKNYLNL